MKSQDLNWIDGLYEVGTPITDERNEIQWRLERAEKDLEQAKKIFAEERKLAKEKYAKLTKKIDALWTPEEIKAAKGEIV